MKNLFKLLWLTMLCCNISHAQPLTIGDWQQLKMPSSIGGTAYIDEVYKGRIYANLSQGYSSTNQGLSWEVYNNNPYYTNAGSIKKIGGRLTYASGKIFLLKDYNIETWDTLRYMFRDKDIPFKDRIHTVVPHKDSVLAIGISFSDDLNSDTLYMLKADTITWKFKQIAANLPHQLIALSSICGVKCKGDSIFMCYRVRNANFSSTLFTTMSSDGGRNWKTVCMGSEYSLTLQGNALYTINRVTGDSLAVFRRNLPDTSITILKVGMTKKSFSPFNATHFKLYTHKNKVYMNGLDGVYFLNGLAWQKIGVWPPNTPWHVLQLYFEGDTIWATTSSGLFRYTSQSPVWEFRGNGLEVSRYIQLLSVKDNKVLTKIDDSNKNPYALSENYGESPNLILVTDFFPKTSYALHGSDKIIGYDDRIRRSTNNGLVWEENNAALPANQKNYGMISKGNYLFVSLGENGVVYRSDDDGATWQIKNNGKPFGFLPYNELFVVNDVLYQYRGWSLYRSADDGENWTKCNFTNTIVFAKSGPAHYGNEVFLCLENSSDYFHSADNGLTWTKKTTSTSIGNIVFNIGNELFFMKQDYPVGKIYRYTGDINNTVYVADTPYPRWINKIAYNDSLLYISDGTNDAKVYYAPYQTLLPTSIKNNVQQSIAVRMYPNPARESVTLELPANVNQAQISILDVLGKELMQTSSTESKVNVSLRSLSAGVYFVRIQTPQGSSTKRLLVQE